MADWLTKHNVQQQNATTISTVKADTDWLAKKAAQQKQQVEQPSIFQVEAERRGGQKTERTKQQEAEKAIAEQKAAQEKFEADNVKLDTGEYISKIDFDKLTAEDQKFIREKGIAEYNKLQESRSAEQLKNYTLLDTGEYVTNEIFNKLTVPEQQQLKAEGIAKFNEYIAKWNKIHEENKAIIEQYQRDAPTLMKTYGLSAVPIYDMKGNLLNDAFPTMNQRASQYTYIRVNPDQPNDIQGLGIPVLKGTEQYAFEIGKKLPSDLTVSFWEMAIGDCMGGAARSQHVTIMDKDGNSVQLPIQVAAKELIDTGTINIPDKLSIPAPSSYNYGDYVNSAGYPLKEQPQYYETKYVKFMVNGKQYVTREEYADQYRTMLEKISSGDSKYASVQMPSPYSSEVIYTTKDGKKESKPLGDAYKTVMTEGKWKPNPYYGGGSSQFNVYIGNPTSLGGTWGNTPATLAAQVSGVSNLINFQTIDSSGTVRPSTQDEINQTIQSTLQQFTPAQMSAYKQTLGELKEIAKSTPAGVDPLVVWQQRNKEQTTDKAILGMLNTPMAKMESLKQSTIDIIDKLNQGLVKYENLSKEDKDSLSKTAIQTQSGDWTVKEDFARANGYVVTNLGELIKKEDYDRLGNDTDAKNTLIEKGVEYYNKWIEDRPAPEGYIKLGDGNYMKQDDYNSFLDRTNGKEMQVILKDKGISGLETYIEEQKGKLKEFVYTDDNGENQIDIVNAMRAGVNDKEVQKAIGTIYTSSDLQDIAKDNIIEPKNDIEKWQVWGEQNASPATIQNLSKENANNLLTGILGNALTELGKINTTLEGTVGKWRDEQLNKIAPGFADQAKRFAKEFANVETKTLQSINKDIIAVGEKIELGYQSLAKLNPLIGVPLSAVGGALESVSTIPATMASGLLTSLTSAKNAIVNAQSDEQRKELINNAILPIATIGAGTVAFFAGVPQKFATSPFEAGRTIGMFIGPEKVLSAAKALKVKLDPSGISNTALSFQIDVDRIQVPKNLNPAQAHEYIAEIQNRVVEGAATALRENKDVIINDPLTGKAIGHMTAFEQGVKGTMFHAAPDAKSVFIEQINKDREITVGKGGEAQKWGGMFFSEQLAPSFLARRAPTDPVIIATRITPKDIGNPMDISRVQKLMWDGKLSEARDLFLELGRQGKLEKKVYTPYKSYIDSSGIMRIEQELWAAPGFVMKATNPKWYAKKSGTQTAQTYTTSPISVGGKPFLRPRATAVVIDRNNRVLLVRDQGRPYSLPGGLIEKGESAKATVLREIKEETGLDLSNAKISGAGKYIDKEPVYDATGNVVYIEGRPAYNEHTIFKIKVDSFSKAKAKGELRDIGSASIDTIASKKMNLEGYAPVITGKATGTKYIPQKEFKAEQASLKYGQDVPILWLASENALKEGLGVPKLAQLYKTELINLVTDIRRMLPWNVKVSKVTVDPEATATGSWIGTKLTGVKLEGSDGTGFSIMPQTPLKVPSTPSIVIKSKPTAPLPKPSPLTSGYQPKAAGQTSYMIGDRHGDYTGTMSILKESKLINDKGEWTGNDAKLSFLGDLTDRGKSGIKIIEQVRKLQDEAKRDNGEVKAILGNHDASLVAASFVVDKLNKRQIDLLRKYVDELKSSGYNRSTTLHKVLAKELSNAGIHSEDRGIIQKFSKIGGNLDDAIYVATHPETRSWIQNLPAMDKIGNDLIFHADNGKFYLSYGNSIAEVNAKVAKMMKTKQGAYQIYNDMNRPHQRGFKGTGIGKILETFGGDRAIHGHTPTKTSHYEVYKEGRAVNINDVKYYGQTRGDIFRATVKSTEKPKTEYQGITKEASDILMNADLGGTPAFISKNFERILKDNGFTQEQINKFTPNEAINQLRAKASKQFTKSEQFTRADESKIDSIVREVETKAREAEAKGESYEKAFVREANKMASNFEGEYGRDLPYRVEGKFRLPVRSIPDTFGIDKSSIDKVMVKEFTADKSVTAAKEKGVAELSTEKMFPELYTPEKVASEKKGAKETTTKEIVPEGKRTAEKEITPSKEKTITLPAEKMTPAKEKIEIPVIPYKPPPVKKQKDRDIFESLTKQQKLASIAWRQGLFYHLIYPPYGFNNVLHDTKPFSGVKVVKGPESAYKSLSRVRGEGLPDKVHWDLGIKSIIFEKGKKGVVKMSYVPNPKMKTVRRGPVGMPQQETITRIQ